MSEAEHRVGVTVDGHVAHVRLERPEKRNGLDLPMFLALVEAGERLQGLAGVRAVVLSGEGKAFCAGLDWASFLALGAEGAEQLLAREGNEANLAQRVCRVWQEVPVPVFAALHGSVLGGGLQLALGADVRYVHPEAQLSAMELRYGLVPDMGLSTMLLRLVRDDLARELLFTGRVVGGEEAVRLGLATRLSADPLAEAFEAARAVARKAPRAVRAAKTLAESMGRLDRAASLRLETDLQRTLLGGEEQMEAVRAAMEKREPEFTDP